MKPVLCNYYVTYRCNAACGFCDIWEQPSPMISLDDARRNLDDLRRLGVRIIDFTGGEPLLHTRLHDLLAMAKARGFLTTVTTNGLLYPKRARQLAGLVDLLHFSIDSSDPAEHDASRGVHGFDTPSPTTTSPGWRRSTNASPIRTGSFFCSTLCSNITHSAPGCPTR